MALTGNQPVASRPVSGRTAAIALLAASMALIPTALHAAGSGVSPVIQTAASDQASPSSYNQIRQISTIDDIARDAMQQYHLKAIIVQVRCDGENIRTLALGESMTGVPATPAMHFRNGAMAFTYMSTMLMELVDEKQVELKDPLSNFLPDLPDANRTTLKNLANMTSGYADYVYTPELLKGTVFEPFRQWTSEELIHIGITHPRQFEPGANWGYSHTNYVILGRVLEHITHMPLDEAMQKYIYGPMDLHQTRSSSTPEIPEPVLHAFSSEQRGDFEIPLKVPFYEESTFWNPSWTTAEGAVQTTDITDMSKSMEVVGTGRLLSKKSYEAQVGPNLIGFGHKQKGCAACRRMTYALNYGLGVVNVGPWITQTKNFAGSGATVGYLPSRKLTVSVVTTYKPEAFDAQGNYKNFSSDIFKTLGNALASNTVP